MNLIGQHIVADIVFLLAITFFFSLPAYAQNENEMDDRPLSIAHPDSFIQFEDISVEDGISDNRINGFLHDSQGYMWFGSQDGLNRYDGYEFTTFWSNPADTTSLSGNYIEVLFEDQTNTMWVGTWGYGLNRYDRQTETFERFRHDPKDSNSLVADYVSAIAEDGKGNLWVGTGDGLSRWEENTKSFKTYRHNPDNEGSLSHDIIRSMLVDQSGVLWVGTGSNFMSPIGIGGLNRYNPDTDSFIRYPGDSSGLVGHHVVALFEDVTGTFWVGTAAGGLHRMDRERGTFKTVAPALREYGYLTFIFEDSKGRFWVGTERGVHLVDRSTGEILTFSTNSSNQESLSQDRVWRMYEDHTGGLWIGCGSVGCLEKVKTEPESFLHYGSSDDQAWDNMYAVTTLRDGTILVGTNSGAFVLDREENQIQRYTPGTVDLPIFEIATMYQDQEGVLWVGGYDGFIAIDPVSGQVNDFLEQIENPDQSYNYIFKIAEGQDGMLWVAGNNGIFRFDRNEQHFIQEGNELLSAFNNVRVWIFSLLIDNQDLIWLGTNQAIYNLELQADELTYILQTDHTNDIHADSSGNIWVASDGGLIYINSQTGRSKTYLRRDGLPSNSVRDIIESASGDLWLATLNGISRFDPSSETFRNFDTRDGLESVAFEDAAMDKQGHLLFAGNSGVAEYIGGEITRNLVPPDVRITNVSASGQALDIGNANVEPSLRLNNDENDLSISFVGLHFEDPSRNQYLTRLDPLDEAWVDPGSDRQVRYTNLDPGEYLFEVRAANSDGVWNEQGATLQVTILPPWWRRWWAYGLYVLIFAAGVFAVDRVQRRRLIAKEREKARERELEQEKKYSNQLKQAYNELEESLNKLEAAQDQLVQQEKLASLGQLTAGIAHEIKNPLNFVNNFSDLSDEMIVELVDAMKSGDLDEAEEIAKDISQNLKKIHEHGTRADGIVKSMLQHSRGGEGKMEPTTLNSLIKEYVNLAFHGMRAGKDPINVDMKLELDENVGKVDLITEDFSRVILNICNNAYDAMKSKLSESAHNYKPRLMVRTHRKDDAVTIEIEDNGPGIPDEIKDKILQPFFTTKKGTAGTGLGLSITHDVIKAHGGQLEIETEKDRFTRFTIHIGNS